jgi:hypothetical protein
MSEAAKLLDRIYARANSQELTLEQVGQQAIGMVADDYAGNRSKTAEFLQVSRSKVVKVLKLSPVVVMLVCLGCATKRANIQHPTSNIQHRSEKQSHQVPMPPMPRTARSGAGTEVNHVARAVAPPVGPAAPRKLTLVCDKNEPHPDAVTELWATTDFVNWTLFAESKEPVFTFVADQPQMFFDARNRLFGQVSAWASGR